MRRFNIPFTGIEFEAVAKETLLSFIHEQGYTPISEITRTTDGSGVYRLDVDAIENDSQCK